ncbi:MAG: hypothetical protein WBC83_03380 [Minisyncoccia bacterium]
MRHLTKITTAETNTLVALALLLSVWAVLSPWISFTIDDLSNWLLSMAVSSGPYRLADKNLYDLLENIYHTWWSVGIPFFYVLTIIQLFVIVPLGLYLLQLLFKRYKSGEAKLWQLLLPVTLAILVATFTLYTAYLIYLDWRLPVNSDERVDVVNSPDVFEGTSTT